MPDSTLHKKLLAITERVETIAKTGHNDHSDYDYVESAQVLREIRKQLIEQKLVVLPSSFSPKHEPAIGGRGFITTVLMEFTIRDTETGEEITLPWVGAGSDIGGDKGLYKAYTGAIKYFLLDLFLVPTGNDPERDEITVEEKSKDAERPAAPRIPINRAKAILEAATEAGLAEIDDGTVTLKPVFIAKLADVGVDDGKIGHLNVDQAEDVEAFILGEKAVS